MLQIPTTELCLDVCQTSRSGCINNCIPSFVSLRLWNSDKLSLQLILTMLIQGSILQAHSMPGWGNSGKSMGSHQCETNLWAKNLPQLFGRRRHWVYLWGNLKCGNVIKNQGYLYLTHKRRFSSGTHPDEQCKNIGRNTKQQLHEHSLLVFTLYYFLYFFLFYEQHIYKEEQEWEQQNIFRIYYYISFYIVFN